MPDHPRNKTVMFSALLKNENSMLGRLCQHADFLGVLENRLRLFLDSPLNTHCIVANYYNSTLILHADSAAWASKLRYNTPAILAFMQNECKLKSLKTIRIKVIPASTQHQDNAGRRLSMSAATGNLINQVAATMPDDELRLSLLKLAKHHQDAV